MYQQDTILRQIEMLTQALARIFFRKEKVVYEFPEQETGYSDDDVWYARILSLLASSEINAAEDALFAALTPHPSGCALRWTSIRA